MYAPLRLWLLFRVPSGRRAVRVPPRIGSEPATSETARAKADRGGGRLTGADAADPRVISLEVWGSMMLVSWVWAHIGMWWPLRIGPK
jgi:hypothetical protein